MKIHKILTAIILSLGLFLYGADAQIKKGKIVGKPKPRIITPVTKSPIDVAKSDTKILLEGSQSKVETPFLFVARDAETYALMRGLVEGLPSSSTIDFSKTAVVAAFAGMRNTGGWSVTVRRLADKTIIDLNAPPRGAMTAQIITYPFQIAAVPLDENQALKIEPDATWTSQIKTFRVSKSDFEYSGGIAGRGKKFNAEGAIGVLKFGNYLTYIFDLSGKGGESRRKLAEIVSGVMKDGAVEFARLDAGTFSESPHPALKVTGTATDKKLSLNFESLAPTSADGFMAKGKLEAVSIK
ncbi:MAG: protease complex subunit PrcB family protein [Pyrinomonadaceae bacterium]